MWIIWLPYKRTPVPIACILRAVLFPTIWKKDLHIEGVYGRSIEGGAGILFDGNSIRRKIKPPFISKPSLTINRIGLMSINIYNNNILKHYWYLENDDKFQNIRYITLFP